MLVQLELYASLMKFLPPRADRHRFVTDVGKGTSINTFLDAHHVPREHAHLVLKNGVFVHCEERDTVLLNPGDVIVV